MTGALTEAQKAFIESKVKELGSVEAVETFYNLKDDASKYAIAVARGEPTETESKNSKAKARKVKRRNLKDNDDD